MAEATDSPGSSLHGAEAINSAAPSLHVANTTKGPGSSLQVAEAINSTGSSLHVLPVEILQYISTNFLPVDAAASLSICSHSMLNILGDQALRSLRLQTHAVEQTRFIKTLERDLPDLLFCHRCEVLHPVFDVSTYNEWAIPPLCREQDGSISIGDGYFLRFEDVYTLMRDYRLGRDYETKLKQLCKSITLDLPEVYREDVVTATIVAGELRIYIQYTLRPHMDWGEKFLWDHISFICKHLQPYADDSILPQALFCYLSHVDRLPCVSCRLIKRCLECSTSVQVEVRVPEDLGTEVKVDVWRDLGSCESSFDTKWRGHADEYYFDSGDLSEIFHDMK